MQKASLFLLAALLFVLALLTLLPLAPHMQPLPQTDSSVFLYIGQRMREGEVPYRDVWDHKGPLIYFIQLLGLSLLDGSRWGVWLLELLFIFGAAWTAFIFLRRIFGPWPAVFGSAIFLFHLPGILEGGNLVEEYGLLFQFAFLLAFALGLQTRQRRYFALAGLAAACLFFLRANLVAIPLAAGVVLLGDYIGQRQAARRRELLALLAGALSLALVIGLYFIFNHAFADMLDAAFRFNFAYSSTTALQQAETARIAMQYLGMLTILALGGWGLLVSQLHTYAPARSTQLLMATLAAALPLEVALSSLSGRAYPHYYMSWLPITCSLAAYLVYRTGLAHSASADIQHPPAPRALVLSLLLGYVLFYFMSFQHAVRVTAAEVADAGIPRVILSQSSATPTLEYIRTLPDAPLLVWGNTLGLNWYSGRAAPTRFAYQAALFEPAYVTPEMVQELIADLEAHPDTVIIDTTSGDFPFLSIGTRILQAPPMLQPLYAYVRSHYLPVAKMERTGWQVYLPMDN